MRHKKSIYKKQSRFYTGMVYEPDLSDYPVEDREILDDRDLRVGNSDGVSTICECGSRSELFKHNKNKT